MHPDVLKLELESLGLLTPKIRGLASRLRLSHPDEILTDLVADTATSATARSVTAQTLPTLMTIAADRLMDVSDRVDQVRTQFANADADGVSVISACNQVAQASPAIHI
ncbi:hypothetical protein ACX9NE_15380 [Mycobacterium sp. ML4]